MAVLGMRLLDRFDHLALLDRQLIRTVSLVLFLSLALLPPVITRSRYPHTAQHLAHRPSLAPMGFDQLQHRLFLNRHQPPILSQSKFISFFNSLIISAWLSTTSLSLRFS